jgi:mono/diheme cytochrome c family protein
MFKRVKELFMPVLLAAVFLGGIIIMFTGNNGSSNSNETATAVEVKVPEFTALAKQGEIFFNENCSACHGKNAAGTDRGPSFVDDIYNPGHHADEAFWRAASTGVRAHHWPFGNMPVISDVTPEEVTAIVRYVRELQVANGIATRAHTM